MNRKPSLTSIALPEVTLSEADGVRYLHLDTPWIQGGMRIKKPQVVEIDYVQRMLASLLWLPTEALGEGQAVHSTPRPTSAISSPRSRLFRLRRCSAGKRHSSSPARWALSGW